MSFPPPPDGPLEGVAEEARPLAGRTRLDLGRLADVRVPDSAAATEAERLARAESSPMLYGHALRSYFYAALLAAHDRMDYDQELLYVGCVLHDIGLTPRFADPIRPFEHVSADVCAELAERHGWALARRYRLHRAVVLHMAPTLPPAEDAEVLLLEAGVACDVTGARSQELNGRAAEELLARYPRAGFKREFTQLLRSEAAHKRRRSAARTAGEPHHRRREHGQGCGRQQLAGQVDALGPGVAEEEPLDVLDVGAGTWERRVGQAQAGHQAPDETDASERAAALP